MIYCAFKSKKYTKRSIDSHVFLLLVTKSFSKDNSRINSETGKEEILDTYIYYLHVS